jgi:hypothetical protein
MIDADLAELYGVATKRLNQQVRRNIERFPEDFMFGFKRDAHNFQLRYRIKLALFRAGQPLLSPRCSLVLSPAESSRTLRFKCRGDRAAGQKGTAQ